jgi:L-fuculose-phosphate aldolase
MPAMLLADARRQIVAVAQRLRPDGLVAGTAGNLSIRSGDLVAATPSGVDYDDLTPETIGVHQLDGSPVDAPLAPTSELPMHLAVYERTDGIDAIVHTHSPAAAAVTLLVDELPRIHYYVALFGGTSIRVAPYARFGTTELAENVAAALRDRTGALLEHHGALTGAATLEEAYTLALHLEWLCDVYLRARAAGEPKVLSEEQLAETLTGLEGYGQPDEK